MVVGQPAHRWESQEAWPILDAWDLKAGLGLREMAMKEFEEHIFLKEKSIYNISCMIKTVI